MTDLDPATLPEPERGDVVQPDLDALERVEPEVGVEVDAEVAAERKQTWGPKGGDQPAGTQSTSG